MWNNEAVRTAAGDDNALETKGWVQSGPSQRQFDFDAGLVTFNIVRSRKNPPGSKTIDTEEFVARGLPLAEARAMQERLDRESAAAQVAKQGYSSSWTMDLHFLKRIEVPTIATAKRNQGLNINADSR